MTSHLRRRELITLLGSAAAWPLAARAQQLAMPVIGFLSAGSPENLAQRVRAFRQGLSERGYVEGRNVAIEYRWTGDRADQQVMAAELVRRSVTVMVADGATAVSAAKAATAAIPVVFFTASDPVAIGFVASLSRPGGNLTGVTSLGAELAPKRLELLHELLPAAKSFGFLVNPDRNDIISDMQAASRAMGLEVHVLPTTSARDLDAAFATLAQRRAAGLVINSDNFFSSRAEQLAGMALRQRVPAIFQFHEFVASGGLMSYGGSVTDQFRTLGLYVGRILQGEKPADLPVQQVTKVELIINMKTAKALGLTFPITLLGRADEVIE